MNLNFVNDEYNDILKEVLNNKVINKDNICAICKEPLLIDSIDLSCNHRYHSECLISTFIKYQPKTCPLCNKNILISSYKSSCSVIMGNKKICGRESYNNESLCKLHTKVFLKRLNKKN